ncbi:Z1 domain-containing protein [Spiroplasma alleghenense]|uniref:Endonuclease n=1 Tax=Spiroplasma alleghenense TaxID=216931 RepID=A0A345Z4U0_9MOLU|nr:Z1 domain-containing protein [Spiroplasma alleghenense]AXK51619.1 endonuclease [Spiroplasma alleghenense]
MRDKIARLFTEHYAFGLRHNTEEGAKSWAIRQVIEKLNCTEEEVLESIERDESKTFTLDKKNDYEVKAINRNYLTIFNDYINNLLDSNEVMFEDVEDIKKSTLDLGSKINISDELEKFSIKGLVLGDIQSGKTTNFMALTSLAFDLGYKRVIILTGLLEDLRVQTLNRAKSALGHPDEKVQDNYGGWMHFLSKGINFPTKNGDIKKDTFHNNQANEIQLKNIWIIKKTAANLKKINDYFENVRSVFGNEGNDKPINFKTLIIDDEADQASLESSGTKTDKSVVSKTYEQITKLATVFPKCCYIGYTASPFANLLTDKDRTSHNINLYPDDFITVLNPGKYYTGYQKFLEISENSKYSMIPLKTEEIENLNSFFKDRKAKLSDNEVFKKAFQRFIISGSILKLRELNEEVRINKVKTMMINIHHVNKNQDEIVKVIKELIKYYSDNINNANIEKEFETIFYKEYSEINEYSWIRVWEEIKNIFLYEKVKIVIKNSSNGFADENNAEFQVWVGGYKLSRGMTVPCLLTSIFYRNTKMADTLMQMCRWFGYRTEYIDLCKIFTSEIILDMFFRVFSSFENLKNDLREMNERDLTPEQIQIKIEKFSNGMKPSSLNKIKGAIEVNKVSFSGRNFISTYFKDDHTNEYNLEKTKNFINQNNVYVKNKYFKIYENISYNSISGFLSELKLPEVSNKNLSHIKEKMDKIKLNKEYFEKWKVVISTNIKDNNGTINLREFNINLSSKSVFSENIKFDEKLNLQTFRLKSILTTSLENFEKKSFEDSKNDKFFKSTEKAKIRTMKDGPVLFIIFSKIISKNDEEKVFLKIAPTIAMIIPKNEDPEFQEKYDNPFYINQSSGEII